MAKLEAYDKALDYSYAPGIFPATECLKNAKKRCMRLLVSSNGLQSEGVQALERDAQEAGVRVEVADRALERISKKENCFAAMVYKKAEGRFDEDSPHIVLHHPSDSGNLGTILRTALGFGLKNIAIIRPAVDSDDPRVVRAKALYTEDESKAQRKSHKNAAVQKLYEDYLGQPNSHKAHELLHTHYVDRSGK